MTISTGTLYTDIYTDVKAVLVAARTAGNLKVTNLTSAEDTNAEITSAYNDKRNSTPQVILEPTVKSEGPRYKFGSNQGKEVINIPITVYYKKQSGVNQLKQQVETAMKAAEFTDMMLIGVDVDDAFINPNEAKYFSSTLTFTYDREV